MPHVKPDLVYRMLVGQKSPNIRELKNILGDETHSSNAIFRLSINDYNKMCESDVLRRKMTKPLNTTIENLTTFCKLMNTEGKKHIDLSKKTITEKLNAMEDPLSRTIKDFPVEIQLEFLKFYQEILPYELRDWIREELHKQKKTNFKNRLIDYDCLSANYNAIDFLSLQENKNKINYNFLSRNTNPKAIPLLKERIKEEKLLNEDLIDNNNRIDWTALSGNPIAFDLLKDKAEEEEGEEGEDDDVGKYIDWGELSANKIVFKLLKHNPSLYEYLDYGGLSANSSNKALDILEEKLRINPNDSEIDWELLSGNTNTRAINLLRLRPDKIDFHVLSGNTNEKAIEILKVLKNKKLIAKELLSFNPSIFIKAKLTKIN